MKNYSIKNYGKHCFNYERTLVESQIAFSLIHGPTFLPWWLEIRPTRNEYTHYLVLKRLGEQMVVVSPPLSFRSLKLSTMVVIT